MLLTKKVFVSSLIVITSGCANFAPEFSLPDAPVSENIIANNSSADAEATTFSDIDLVAWQDFFQNQNTKELIALALKHNRDLHIAAANVAEAQGMFQVQRQEYIPSVSLNNSVSTSLNSTELSGNNNISRNYQFNVGLASYEIDFWGRVKNLNNAALASYFSTLEAQRSSQLSVISSTANAYSNWLAASEKLNLSNKTLAGRSKSYELIKLRESIGIASALDLAQAEVAKVTVEAQQAKNQRGLSNAKAALELLVGTPLNEIMKKQEHGPRKEFGFAIPNNLNSNVILARPDIIAAEENLRANNANIGAARAAFFPKVNLVSSLGLASNDLSNLFNSSAKTWSFAPSISLPLFGNSNKANLDIAKARQDKGIAQYEKAIQTAFSEIYTNLAARNALRKEIDANSRLVKAEQKRLHLAETRYNAGLSSYIEVLDSQQNLFNSQQSLLESERGEAESIIQLYKALGGGDALKGSFRERSQQAKVKQ